jgi:protein-S-isoprenylcysteine O-methyltransferase Ste14
MFLLFGTAEVTRNIWFVIAAFVFAGLVWILQIRPEERHLEQVFGDAWRAYAARTRTFL